MRTAGLLACMFLFFSSITLAQTMTNNAESGQTQMTDAEKFTYSLGLILANDLQKAGVDKLDTELVTKAINDLKSGQSAISLDEANKFVGEYKVRLLKKEGEDFLAMNSTKAGVVVLPSGLQYEIMKSGGSDQKPSATDKVKTHYHGMLIDGTVFDSSVDRGEPISFPVNGVIKGWQEALQLMSVGDKWKLYIPSDLAYGPRGAGGVIAPYAALIFEVELLGIE